MTLEVLVVAVRSQIFDACLRNMMLPPVIVHPDAGNVRDVLLYNTDDEAVGAICRISGWGWHCAQALVRTARVEWMDEVLDDVTNYHFNFDQLDSPGIDSCSLGTSPLVNCLAIHHRFDSSCPSPADILRSAICNRRKLMDDPLFGASIKKMQTEPLVQTFFNSHSGVPD
jgi:hypothetical protein